ncbi:transcriptional repressor p66-alpha-like [Pseudorasbora parva]|uniref:transcriptional repressor p66-alpha-like n=1 Tax=Pseudorasbora parva TaxID=51549 RepID=UPI00351F03BB
MPPLFRGAQVSSSSSGPSPLQPGLIRKTSIPSSSLLVLHQAAGANLQPCSRQAALHKQLEESLLEIPRPRPEPQLSFMPSAAGQQFLSLLGLEEAVQRLLDALGRGKQGLYAGLVVSSEPCCCSQCKTDFTCRWRTDKGGAILCERCMSSNQKKALKAEHTNRLKAVFLKAVQQEQRLLQQATPPAVHGPKPRPLTTSSSAAHGVKPRPLTTSSSAAHGVKPRPLTTSSSAAHGVKPRPLPASIRQVCPSGIRAPPPSSSQLQLVHQTGKHAVRQWSKVSRGRSADPTTSSWRKQSRGAAGVTMAYVNPSLSGHRMSSAEFLLNLIPSRTANSWK